MRARWRVTHDYPFVAALVLAPAAASVAALVFGWFCVRLSGIYLAMLTLAFAQIVWSIALQWDAVTGGSNGIVGVWPPDGLRTGTRFYSFRAVHGGGRRLSRSSSRRSRHSAMRCAAAAIRRCAQRHRASTCARRSGSGARTRRQFAGWPAASTRFRRAASRPRRSRFRARSMRS